MYAYVRVAGIKRFMNIEPQSILEKIKSALSTHLKWI